MHSNRLPLYLVLKKRFGDLPQICDEILNESIAITAADFGNVQLLNTEGTGLEIIAQRGFNLDFLRYFEHVAVDADTSCCARAVRDASRIVINDVENDLFFSPHVGVARTVPFRAVQSTPLLGADGRLLGIVSTHYREPRPPDSQQLQALDDYLATVVDVLEKGIAASAADSEIETPHINASHFLKSIKFFRDVNDMDRRLLLGIGSVHEYEKDDDIFRCGDKAEDMFIVLNGWVKIYNVNDIDKESGVILLTQGEEFGAEAIFDGGSYIFSAKAETKTQILKLPAAALKMLARVSPDIASTIMHMLSNEIKQRQIAEICLRHKKATQRLACLMLRLTSWMQGKGGTFRMPYKKSVAAAQLDMDQATFSRTLADMKMQGVTTSDGEITIEDFTILVCHSCQHCAMDSLQCIGRRLHKDTEEKS